MTAPEWGSREWHEAHFPKDQLDRAGDTWGIRWRGMEKMRHASYLNILRDDLRADRPLKVLDLGCALCDFTVKAWELNRRNDFFGVDISSSAIEWVTDRFPQFTFMCASLPDIPFDDRFDLIFCLEVLCYLAPDDRRRAIRNIRTALVPGGKLLFSGVLDGGDRYHTEGEVRELLQHGFEIERVHYNHWALHRRFVELPARRISEPARRLARLLSLEDDELAEWRAEADGSPRASVVRTLRTFNPAARWAVAGTGGAAHAIVGATPPAVALNLLSAALRGRDHADEIVVLARRIPDQPDVSVEARARRQYNFDQGAHEAVP